MISRPLTCFFVAILASIAPCTVQSFLSRATNSPFKNVGTGSLRMSTMEECPTYVQCGKCKAVYSISLETLGKGKKMACGLCSHSWWQTADRMQDLREGWKMADMPQPRMDQIKSNMLQGRSPNFVPGKAKGEATIFIGNLPFDFSESDITEMFAGYGAVASVTLVHHENGQSKGYAFVEMEKKDEGEKAIGEMDGTEMNGRALKVAMGGK